MIQTLTEKLNEDAFNIMLDVINTRINNKSCSPANPFISSELVFDYSKISPKYHASRNPEDQIILYKGALKHYDGNGFLSSALNKGIVDHVLDVKNIIEGKDDELIHELLDAHTSYYYHTALLSATFNPEQAQVFAPTICYPGKKLDKTIYKIILNANRCVIDCYDTGGCGSSRELLILGAIFPEEIVSVKILNDDQHSELISSCEHYIRRTTEKDSINTEVKDANNWMSLGIYFNMEREK